jgi:fluoride exporter
MTVYLWIAIGSALGGMARYWIASTIAHRWGESFPWGTLVVNTSGSFLIGFLALLLAADGRPFLSATGRQFLLVGILGGFTTFSTFSFQTLSLLRAGEWWRASGNAVGSLVLCLLAVWLGALAAHSVHVVRSSS